MPNYGFLFLQMSEVRVSRSRWAYDKVGAIHQHNITCNQQFTSMSNTKEHHSSFSHQILVVLSRSQILLSSLRAIGKLEYNI
jgi:hypothetical protein